MNWVLIYYECCDFASKQEDLFMICSEYCEFASEQVDLFVPISHQTIITLCCIAIHQVKYCVLSSLTPANWIMTLPDPLGGIVCS